MKRPNEIVYKTFVIFWLTLSVGSVVLASLSWWQLSSQIVSGKRLVTGKEEAGHIIRLLIDSETGARGYVITGNANFLQPYAAAHTNFPIHFDRLVELVHDDPVLIKKVTDLRAQAELVLNWHKNLVTARMQSFQQAQALVASGNGKALMDEARTRADDLFDLQTSMITDLRTSFRSELTHASLTSIVAGFLGIVAGFIAFWLSRLSVKQKQHEHELMEAKLHAERSNQEKTLFLANMSHEIRTPMNAILGFSELLEPSLKEPKQRQYVKIIRSSASSLLVIINDILDVSKIESGVIELRLEPTDPREICDFLHSLFSEPAAKKNIRLQCHIAEGLPHAVLMDRIRLRQVFINLVGNAVKFTDQGSIDIRINSEKQASSSQITLVIEVQDTGVGIPQDKLDAIFRPFVQSGVHREKENQGTGLGLSIVKRLTELMGGTVTVASVMGQGSAFSLRFPDVPISARLPAQAKLAYASEVNFDELQPATLLVVDDNKTNCNLIAEMFEGTHHRLIFAGSGEEALEKIKVAVPSIVLLDVRMPGMDGRETLREIRKIAGMELVPIIAVTASSLMSEDISLKERFSGYVRKPFSKRELFEELSEFLPGQPKAESGSAKTDAPAVTPARVSPELLAQLRLLMVDPWPSIRDSVAVNESKVFAQGLEGLGQRWQCEPLVTYAQKILHDAENYAVTDLEKHLGEFAVLVEQLGAKP